MSKITTLTFFSFKNSKFWAFKQMGIANSSLAKIEGLQFYKLLGTGGGAGFSLTPDFSTYAFLGVWEHLEYYENCLNTHPFFKEYQKRALLQRDLVLEAVASHAASRAIENAKGVLYYKGIGELPFVQQATVSIWENFEAVNTFAYKGKEHAKIVKMTKKRKWYKEDLFSRFYLLSDQTIHLNS
ncbi:MAG: hypothetical protein EBY37_03840 [Flavobacteriia bacterium]|nr:hypothetical protein [Flavobacteriia bacterium]